MACPTKEIEAMRVQLDELTCRFRDSIREQRGFSEISRAYLQLKQGECQLKGMEWDARVSHRIRRAPIADESHNAHYIDRSELMPIL